MNIFIGTLLLAMFLNSIDLSSQFGNHPNLRTARKNLPTFPHLHYITGVNGNIRIDITPHTGPLEILETMTGNIIAIIDDLGFVRPILNSEDKIVQIMQRSNNHVRSLTTQMIQRYGLNIYFHNRRP